MEMRWWRQGKSCGPARTRERERERERCGRRVRKKGKKEEGSDQEFWTNLVFF